VPLVLLITEIPKAPPAPFCLLKLGDSFPPINDRAKFVAPSFKRWLASLGSLAGNIA